jgi:dynein heavy chain
MADTKFITNLKTRDLSNFSSKEILQLKIHLNKLEEKLDPNRLFSHLIRHEREEKLVGAMNSVSRVGAGLLKFLFAVDHYVEKFNEIKPKKDRLKSLENEFETNRNELTKLETSIDKLSETLEEFRRRFDAAIEEKIRFQNEIDVAERRHLSAAQLLDGFQSERKGWQNDLLSIRTRQDELIGDCLLASAFLSYSSPFPSEIRHEFLNEHCRTNLNEKEIRHDENFRLEHFFSSNIEISEWISQTLPSDRNSIENAILTLKTRRYPFCLDPQGQMSKWIEHREEKSNLKILSMKNRDFIKQLELSMKYG